MTILNLSRRRLAVLAGLSLALSTAIVASPPSASASAAGAATARIAINAPDDIAAGLGAVWVESGGDDAYSFLSRVDPATNRVTATWRLPGDSHGFAVGAGSVWASLYDANTLLRIDPRSGRVIATIPVGLQPEAVRVAFGSVWVANHHGQSVARIDPRRNRVIAQPTVGDPQAYRSGPQQLADDGHRLYVGVSINQSLTTIAPARSRVTSVWSTPTDQFCGDLVPVHHRVWSVDLCSDTLYLLTPAGRHVTAFGYGTAAVNSATLLGQTLWVGSDTSPGGPDGTPPSGGVLQARNPDTGHVERTIDVGGDVTAVRAIHGDLWLADNTNNLVRRVVI